jgi:iron complex transport system substrate-binding protein
MLMNANKPVFPRIISLIPSSTEIVAALDLKQHLVGRSHECDYPHTVKKLPVCTAPKFSPLGTSLDVHRRVQEVLRDSLSVYEVFTDQLEQLQPDIIITQSQCDVCAVNVRDVNAALSDMVSSHPAIIDLQPNTLNDVMNDIIRVANACGFSERGTQLVKTLRQRMRHTFKHTRTLAEKKKVICIEWIEPLMTAGNWIPRLVQMAGGEPLFAKEGKHSNFIDWQDMLDADPDVIILMPCGYKMHQTFENLHFLMNRPEWNLLRAVRNQEVFLTDGNHFFNRPGPRLADSLDILAEILHPGLFKSKYYGTGWIPLHEARTLSDMVLYQ